MKARRPAWRYLGQAVLLLGGAFLLYAASFGHAWTLDDFPVVVNNPDIRSLSAFFENAYPGRPLREVTYLIDYALFGLRPAGYHLQNIFWHGLNACLVLALLRRLQATPPVAWMAALLFLVHPLQVEVVANVAHRKDSLALAFSLFSFLAYIEAFSRGRSRGRWLATAGLLFAIALLAKESALLLPVVFVAYEATSLSPEERFLLRWKGAWVALLVAGALAGLLWYRCFGGLEKHLAAMQPVMAKMGLGFAGKTAAPYFLMVLKSWSFMTLKWLLPAQLAPEYVFPAPGGWTDPWVLAAFAGVSCYGVGLCATFRRRPLLFLALVWLGAFFLPVSNLWPFAYFAADRYLYAPAVGLTILSAVLLMGGAARPSLARRVVPAALIALLSLLTWQQNGIWRSRLSLWSQAVAVSPDSTAALNNLGSVYMERGDLGQARVFYQRAADNFNDPMPYFSLGKLYEKMGDRDRALFYYRSFLAFDDPRHRALARELRQRLYRTYGVTL